MIYFTRRYKDLQYFKYTSIYSNYCSNSKLNDLLFYSILNFENGQ